MRGVRGFSIPELLVAISLGLIVVGAVFVSYAGALTASRFQRASSEMAESAMLALSLIRRDLLLAAYVHPESVTASRFVPINPVVRNRPVFGCAFGFVRGNEAVGMGACVNGAVRSDAIEINFEATLHNADRDGTNRLTDCQGAALDDPATPGVPAAPADASTRIPSSHRYFVRVSPATGIPELVCASAQSPAQVLVSHVQELQITYGVADGWDPGVPATQRAVRYVRGDDVAAWPDVVAVRLCVLMLSDGPVLRADEAQTHFYIDCDGAPQMSADRLLRRAYLTTVSLRNRELR